MRLKGAAFRLEGAPSPRKFVTIAPKVDAIAPRKRRSTPRALRSRLREKKSPPRPGRSQSRRSLSGLGSARLDIGLRAECDI